MKVKQEWLIAARTGLRSVTTGKMFWHAWVDLASAYGCRVTTLPMIAAYAYLQRYMVEGLAAGRVKG